MIQDALRMARADVDEQFGGSPPYRLIDVPAGGKLVEPLIGRRRVADDAAAPGDVRAAAKSVRSQPNDIYEVMPADEPAKSKTMEVLAREGVQVRVQLREDLSAALKKSLKAGYVAEWGFSVVDPRRRVAVPRWRHTFLPGAPVTLTMQAAVGILIHSNHGRFVEEAPAQE